MLNAMPAIPRSFSPIGSNGCVIDSQNLRSFTREYQYLRRFLRDQLLELRRVMAARVELLD